MFEPSSGELVPVDGPSDRGQIVNADTQSVVWVDLIDGVFVADESFQWHRVTFDVAVGVTERLASVALIDGAVVVTARGAGGRFGFGPISVYEQDFG